ncbi:hypothetical protein MASR2M44_19140 [Bacteroidota bacterium]
MLPTISFKRLSYLYGIWWLLWIALLAGIHFELEINWTTALTDSFITNAVLALSGFMLYNTLRYYQPANENFFYLRLWVFLLAILDTAIGFYLLPRLIGEVPYTAYVEQGIYIRFAYNLLMLSTISLINWMAMWFQNRSELEQRKQETDAMAREAELMNLRKQLQPHFLFNSLNSIHTLAGNHSEKAREMIEKLSDFLRHTLNRHNEERISVSEELKGLELYLDIEKIRFGDRLVVSIQTEGSCLAMKVPALVLQPLVENAIKFGVYQTLGQVELNIHIRCLQGMLEISISNPFDAAERTANMGTGFGLDSVRRRMFLLYARQDLLQIEEQNNTFTATLRIPAP